MPAAFMRNYHEAIRNDLTKVLGPALSAGELPAFETAWKLHTAGMAFHSDMEEGADGRARGFFALIEDASEGALSTEVFVKEHAEEKPLAEAVEAALAEQDKEKLASAFEAYRAWALAHLAHEEEALIKFAPKIQKPAMSIRQQALNPAIAKNGIAVFDAFIQHGVRSLAAFGSSGQPPAVAVRVLVHALSVVCEEEDWPRLKTVCEEAAGPAVWSAITEQVPTLA